MHTPEREREREELVVVGFVQERKKEMKEAE